MSRGLFRFTETNSLGAYFVLVFAFTALAGALAFSTLPNYLGSAGHDSQWYIKLSEGRISEVIQPFSGRILYPFLAGIIGKSFSLDASRSFFFLGTASLFLFLLVNVFVIRSTIQMPLLIVPLFFLPYFLEITKELFLPDIFYVFLTAFFFFFLFRGQEGASLIVLFLMFLTRESTILPALILLGLSAWRSKKLFFVGTLFVVVAGVFVTGQIGALGLPNPHRVSGFFYLVLKFTYNFFNNFFGIRLWASTLAQNCEPVFRMALPGWSVFGSIKEAGVCGWNPAAPVDSLLALLTVFGVAPLVLFFIIFKKTKTVLRDAPFWVSFAVLYGIAYYIIGVPAGTGVMRIVGYGWPAFLLAAPFLMKTFWEIDGVFAAKLSFAHIFVAWLPFVLGKFTLPPIVVSLIVFCAVLSVYAGIFFLIRNRKTVTVALSAQ